MNTDRAHGHTGFIWRSQYVNSIFTAVLRDNQLLDLRD